MPAPEHPAITAWTPQPPPPPQRRVGPGLVAGLIALLLVFGLIATVAARQRGVAGFGSSSPEGAATGLLAALDRDKLDTRALEGAARYLTGEERLLVSTYAGRFAALATAQLGREGLGMLGFGARDVRFQRVAGGEEVTVLEAVSGTVRVRTPGGGNLELSLDEARRRLAQQTRGQLSSLRVVTVRAGGRWYVALLPTWLEWARVASPGSGAADYARLTATATPGAASPEAAVRNLLAAVQRPLDQIPPLLAPDERNAFDAYLPAVPAVAAADGLRDLRVLGRRIGGTTTAGTERIADGVARVRLSGTLDPDVAAVVAIRRNGTWYPSMVFTFTDVTVTSAEREHS
jgi:hypothetical protein